MVLNNQPTNISKCPFLCIRLSIRWHIIWYLHLFASSYIFDSSHRKQPTITSLFKIIFTHYKMIFLQQWYTGCGKLFQFLPSHIFGSILEGCALTRKWNECSEKNKLMKIKSFLSHFLLHILSNRIRIVNRATLVKTQSVTSITYSGSAYGHQAS